MDIDPERTKTYNRYRQAIRTERELKPTVRTMAVEDLRAGATVAQLATETGMTVEVFRRLARDNDIPVNERYRGRAEKFRARVAAAADQPEPNERPSPEPSAAAAADVTGLSDAQAAELAGRAFATADPQQFELLTVVAASGDRAVIVEALKCGALTASDVRAA